MTSPKEGCQGDLTLTQRGACSGVERSETSQNSRWLNQPDLYGPEPRLSRPVRKKPGYTQVRLYLPNDVCRKVKTLPPPLRSTVLAMRLRSMDWDIDLDWEALQSGCDGIKEACALLRQALTGDTTVPSASMKLIALMERLVRT